MLSIFKRPIVLMPMLFGILLPCVGFIAFRHFSRPSLQPPLILSDAIYISNESLPSTDLLDLHGKAFASEGLREGKVLLVFVTTDCPACLKELNLLTDMKRTLEPKVKVFAVGVQDRLKILDFVNTHQFSTKMLVDKDAELMRRLHVKYFPARFVLQDGIILKTTFGNSVSSDHLSRELGLS